MSPKIDVVINVFGKVYQTALSLLTLTEQCGQHISKIYFQEEPLTAEYERKNHTKTLEYFSDIVEHFTPRYWNGIDPTDLERAAVDYAYLLSIRYQYGWEKTESKYLLTIHNDIDVRADIVGNLLTAIGDHTGVGEIGQCWWCPAFQNGLCDSERYTEFKPSYQYLMKIYNKGMNYTQRRAYNLGLSEQFQKNAWPLPECRLNEWCALIDMDKARKSTLPNGYAAPFGARLPSGACIGENWDRPVCLDVGVQWFRDMLHMGHTFGHYDVNNDIVHDKRGSVKLDSAEAYVKAEMIAFNKIKERFPEFFKFMQS
ncbi:hypothetical protein [Maridesulfovibrio zosterae]|uniref:hypothetical protein n=1 Tax=Maridesulfovibrio zosterae TaxID=82171 RepID=UPI000418D60D|nr:hypothetical protein [Maridesulfovibrio zosterae]